MSEETDLRILTTYLENLYAEGIYYDEVAKFPDGDYTVMIYRDFPLKDRFREIFQAQSITSLTDAIRNTIDNRLYKGI